LSFTYLILCVTMGFKQNTHTHKHMRLLTIDHTDAVNLELLVVTDLVWFGLFVHPFSHICNIGYINYRLQFTTLTYNIWT